jgi:hypothetical protein
MCDGYGNAASTDLVWYENPSLSHDSIDALVELYLGVDSYHVLPDPLGEYIEHIDCWGKFLDVDKVLIGEVPPGDPRYADFEYVADYFAQTASAWGNNYQVYRVYTPGDNLVTPYTNSLILNKKVLVPLTGSSHDTAALQVYEQAMPGYQIEGIPYDAWFNTDALHCRAKGIADTGMLYIKHFPLLGYQEFNESWKVIATIHPLSGMGLIPDSVYISYSVNSASFQTVAMTNDSASWYSAEIPFQLPGAEIAYYINAGDSSGRVVEHPVIGQPDPHVFKIDTAVSVWNGENSTNWADSLNWHNQFVPDSLGTAIVPGALASYPIINGTLSIGTATGESHCMELIIRSGASVTVTDSVVMGLQGRVRIDPGAGLNVGSGTSP